MTKGGIVKRSSCIAWGILAAATLASGPASAELKTFVLAWTSPGSGIARGALTIDDALCNNPGMNTLAGPAGCFVELTFTVSGDIKGKGTLPTWFLNGRRATASPPNSPGAATGGVESHRREQPVC